MPFWLLRILTGTVSEVEQLEIKLVPALQVSGLTHYCHLSLPTTLAALYFNMKGTCDSDCLRQLQGMSVCLRSPQSTKVRVGTIGMRVHEASNIPEGQEL